MNTLVLLLAAGGTLLLPGCGADTPPAQRVPARRLAALPPPAAPNLAAHESDSASLEDVQRQVLSQLNRDPLVGNVGHDFAHLVAIYERSIQAGAERELRTGQHPGLLQLAAAVRGRALALGAAAERLAQDLHGRTRNYAPDDFSDPFTRGVRESLKVSMRAHAAAALPDHDFAALLAGQRQSVAAIARAALATGRLPAAGQALARQVLAPRPAETQLLQSVLRKRHPAQ